MQSNPRGRRRPKMPASIEAPKWALEELSRALDRRMESDVPGPLRERWNVALREQKHGVAVPFAGSYQGKAAVQVGAEAGLYEDSGNVVLPLVAYVVAGGTTYDITLSNARLYLLWEPLGTERTFAGKYSRHLLVAKVADAPPDMEGAMQELRQRVAERERQDMSRNPPPPPRRPAPRLPPPPRRGPASVLTSVRRMMGDSDRPFDPGRYDRREQPFDPARHQPHGVKPHHFAVNASKRPNPVEVKAIADTRGHRWVNGRSMHRDSYVYESQYGNKILIVEAVQGVDAVPVKYNHAKKTWELQDRWRPYDDVDAALFDLGGKKFTSNGHFEGNPAKLVTPSQRFAHKLANELMNDGSLLAELYMEPPDPKTAIRKQFKHWMREAFVFDKNHIIESASDIVCMVGQESISQSEVEEELEGAMVSLLSKGRKEALHRWPADEVEEASARLEPAVPAKRGRSKTAPKAPAPRAPRRAAPPVDTRDTTTRVLAAFDELNARGGRRNYVTLYDMRNALPDVSRPEFDRAIQELRRKWVLTLDPAEGRHERLPEEVLDAGIYDQQTLLVYAARRDDEEVEFPEPHFEPLDVQIERAALALGGGRGKQRIRITELKDRIPVSQHEAFTDELLKMQQQGRIVLYRNDNPRDIKPADERDAIWVAGHPRHIVYLLQD